MPLGFEIPLRLKQTQSFYVTNVSQMSEMLSQMGNNVSQINTNEFS
jgi:hypothetical protein